MVTERMNDLSFTSKNLPCKEIFACKTQIDYISSICGTEPNFLTVRDSVSGATEK